MTGKDLLFGKLVLFFLYLFFLFGGSTEGYLTAYFFILIKAE